MAKKEKPTHWTLGWSLEAELGFSDGKYLPRKAALILYPEYFDEQGEPILDMLPIEYFYASSNLGWVGAQANRITHWMPLPELPGGE